MINYDSIISAYNDKPTLMEWLKKVEEALKGASATSFSVNKKGAATISFQIDFDDGTSLESGEIILQQGESVTGASIVNGHLILTLSNGDNLDAGNLGAVSGFSINGSQHLIVTYQDGTTNDLGAIFNGNVNISGVLSASSVSTPLITSAGASVEFGKPIDVDVLTSSEEKISTQKPVVEIMMGYLASASTAVGYTIGRDYIGACKNGNKLTFALSGHITRTAAAQGANPHITTLTIPAEIGALLVPSNIGSATNFLCSLKIQIAYGVDSYADITVGIMKNSNTSLAIAFFGAQNLSQDVEYYYRFDVTFLLSPNLAA